MAKKIALTTVPKSSTAEKKERERISLIEMPPRPEWFVRTREHGRTVWYLRLIVTGMLPRRFGPFASRHKALLALDAMLDEIGDVNADICDRVEKYRLKRRFQHNWGPVIEDNLALPTNGDGR